MIINFLVKALCEKESVYVNNLGLFRKEYDSAHIIDGMITPPGYKVVFDPDFDGNGFAFTMFVSQKGGLLITEATTQIDQWVTQLKTALDHNKSVCFENFGTFAKNEHGIISFVCDRIAELNVEYEGMEPVAIGSQKATTEVETEEKEETIAEKEVATHNKAESVVEEEEASVEKEETSGKEEETSGEGKTEEEQEPRKKRTWVIILLIMLIAALLASAAYYFRDQLSAWYQQYFDKENTEQVTETTGEESPTIATIDTSATETNPDSLGLLSDSAQTVAIDENIPTEPVPSITSQLPEGEKFFIDYEKGKYYVIVGSFRSEKEVREHIKSRKLEQYNPKVVLQQNSKNLRICIGVFDTEAAADSYGRSTGLNYWVLK